MKHHDQKYVRFNSKFDTVNGIKVNSYYCSIIFDALLNTNKEFTEILYKGVIFVLHIEDLT